MNFKNIKATLDFLSPASKSFYQRHTMLPDWKSFYYCLVYFFVNPGSKELGFEPMTLRFLGRCQRPADSFWISENLTRCASRFARGATIDFTTRLIKNLRKSVTHVLPQQWQCNKSILPSQDSSKMHVVVDGKCVNQAHYAVFWQRIKHSELKYKSSIKTTT